MSRYGRHVLSVRGRVIAGEALVYGSESLPGLGRVRLCLGSKHHHKARRIATLEHSTSNHDLLAPNKITGDHTITIEPLRNIQADKTLMRTRCLWCEHLGSFLDTCPQPYLLARLA
jgi:hypothetical protein